MNTLLRATPKLPIILKKGQADNVYITDSARNI